MKKQHIILLSRAVAEIPERSGTGSFCAAQGRQDTDFLCAAGGGELMQCFFPAGCAAHDRHTSRLCIYPRSLSLLEKTALATPGHVQYIH